MTAAVSFRKEVATFLVLTFAFSSVMYYLIISSGSLVSAGALYPLLLMWCPGAAALITCALYHRSIRSLGWGWGSSRYQLAAYLLPPAYALLVYGLVWLLGLGGLDSELTRPWLIWLSVGTLFNCFAALGEEIGWRGFLVGRLYQRFGFTFTSVVSGGIWALWHAPLIVFADYHGGAPALFSVVCFTVMCIGVSFAYAWLRLKSGSLWTAMLLHASHNFWIQGLFDPLTTDTGNTRYFIGEFGIGLAAVSCLVALYYWRKRDQLPPRTAANASTK